ncbi:MAG TPA: ABC transporter ATP-binding protein [Candidatus Limnocylindrales bacterium]|jgi:ABC-2 type transport system ATP-binding protein
MTQSGEPVIGVANLCKCYGDVKAVDGVSFEVARGEVFGMLGPNGAGKTTTIEVLEGLRQPDSGTVRVFGLDVVHHPEAIKQRIGVQLQSVSLYPRLTVTELLDLFGSFFSHHLPTKQLIDAVDLGERAKARSMNLSGGQQQRLSIALALVNDPELVFLDEPTTGLDPQARRSLWDLIKGLQEKGKSVMLTTHYMEEAAELCDRVAIMDHGHILEMGSVPELIGRRFKERAVFFDSNPKLPVDQLARLGGVTRAAQEDGQTVLYSKDVPGTIGALLATADGLNVEPHNLGIRQATLEDVFLDLTGRALRD